MNDTTVNLLEAVNSSVGIKKDDNSHGFPKISPHDPEVYSRSIVTGCNRDVCVRVGQCWIGMLMCYNSI